MKKILLTFITLFSFSLSGCAVIAAASGSPDPNLDVVTTGQTRKVIEHELGAPIESQKLNHGVKDLYVYKIGDEPAPFRAIGYAILDIFSLFLWEYIATPIEASNSGNAYELEVEYDKSDIAKKVIKKE